MPNSQGTDENCFVKYNVHISYFYFLFFLTKIAMNSSCHTWMCVYILIFIISQSRSKREKNNFANKYYTINAVLYILIYLFYYAFIILRLIETIYLILRRYSNIENQFSLRLIFLSLKIIMSNSASALYQLNIGFIYVYVP
jgi:hypothetical protein